MTKKRIIRSDDLMDSFIDLEAKESVTGRKVTTENSLSNTIFIVLDTETTSAQTEDVYNKKGELITPKAKVIELAYSRMSPKGVSSHFEDRFYDPGIKIPPSSMSVHNITNKDVAGKPKIEDEIEIIRNDIGDFPILAYNSNFDFKMLPMLQDKKWIDVYKMAAHVWHIGQENEDGEQLTSFKQQEIRFWLNLDDKYNITGEAHRADSDIQVTGFIFQEIKKHYLEVLNKPDNLDDFIEWVDSAPEYKTIPFGPMKVKFDSETGRYGVKPEDLDATYLAYLLSERNPMRKTFDDFGVTDYLKKAYTPKLAAKMRMHYDSNYSSVLSDVKSFEDVENSLSEEERASLKKGGASKEKVLEDIAKGNFGLDEILAKMSTVGIGDETEVLENIPSPSLKVNTPEYNISEGTRAHAKKTRPTKQNGKSYMDKRLKR